MLLGIGGGLVGHVWATFRCFRIFTRTFTLVAASKGRCSETRRLKVEKCFGEKCSEIVDLGYLVVERLF